MNSIFYFTKKYLIFKLLLINIIAITSVRCGMDSNQLKAPKQAIGKANHISVVSDDNTWQSPAGDTLREYLESIFPLMPEPEPMFDLQQFDPEDIDANPIRRNLRVLLFFADLSNENSSTTALVKKAIGSENVLRAKEDPSFGSVVARDVWASGQLLMYVFGHGEKQLAENVRKNFPAIVARMKEFDAKMLESQTYINGKSNKLSGILLDSFGIEMRVPADYNLAISDRNFLWIRKDTRHLNSNIIVYKIKYENKDQLSNEGLKAIQNEVGKYISTDRIGTYMKINDIDLPVFYNKKTISNNFAIEGRGIWEIEGDFMGGPFLSYLVQTSKKDELVLLCGFVHAPGSTKREFMQHLELIFNTAKL